MFFEKNQNLLVTNKQVPTFLDRQKRGAKNSQRLRNAIENELAKGAP